MTDKTITVALKLDLDDLAAQFRAAADALADRAAADRYAANEERQRAAGAGCPTLVECLRTLEATRPGTDDWPIDAAYVDGLTTAYDHLRSVLVEHGVGVSPRVDEPEIPEAAEWLSLDEDDPLDEDDHRDRLDTDGDRLSRRANGLWSYEDEEGMFTLASAEERYGPLRFAVDEPQEAASSHETPPSTPAGPQGGAVEPPPCDSQVVNLDQAKAAPEGVGSADRGLTHSLELTKEGLMPNRTHVTADESSELLDCIISATMGGAYYQAAARAVFEVAGDADLDPLVWIRTSCGNACLNAQHLIVHQPLRIAYPKGVCVYCGFPAGTKDHLIPRPWTGDTRRARVAVVPACAECNSRIGARGGFGIHERRKIAQDGLRKKHKNLLATPVWSEEDLSEMGPTLRVHIEESAKKRAAIQSRLAWPEDPFYDMRAWQKSGIDDPVALGAIAPIGQEAA